MARRILLAEDDLFQATVLTQLLAKLNISVIHAKNGAEAAELFRSQSEPLDLVLLDLQMPVKDGFAAAQEIQTFNSHSVKIYGLSADEDDDTLERAIDVGMESLLKKPVNLKDLQSRFCFFIFCI